ncbi:MAG TPA: SDR family oxidoreductase [Conexibacter sp.]|jgi:NAD(P)-dependent dehydrogenase (short-subunit alcohol dehydrogenase family)
MEFPLATCLVTGAASGIGRAVSETLLKRGAAVLAADRDAAGLDELAQLGARPLAADLTTPEGFDAVVAAARGADVTHLVNAAGVIALQPLQQVDRRTWQQLFAINAEALFFLSQAIVPTLPRGGAVVNLSSTSAKTGTTLETAVYAATKAAVLSLTRSFAHRCASDGVRVNAVCPGIIDTPMQDKVLADVAASQGTTVAALETARIRTVPLGRAASARECAEVIVFLLSDAAAYMTGQSLNVSGGLVTW